MHRFIGCPGHRYLHEVSRGQQGSPDRPETSPEGCSIPVYGAYGSTGQRDTLSCRWCDVIELDALKEKLKRFVYIY